MLLQLEDRVTEIYYYLSDTNSWFLIRVFYKYQYLQSQLYRENL